MSTLQVHGYQDNKIWVAGDIEWEFDYSAIDDQKYLVFSDSTVLKVVCERVGLGSKGVWTITRINAGTAKCQKVKEADGYNNDYGYSDVMVLEGDIKWVTCVDWDNLIWKRD